MLSRSLLIFLSFLYVFFVMSSLTVEKLEEILEEKLQKVIQPLSKQIEDALQSVNALNTKYDKFAKALKDLDEAKKKQIVIKLFDEVTFHIAVFMYKFKNQLLPSNFDVFFTSVKETHNYNTRLSSRMTYALPITRTNYGIFNIRYQGAKIWNAISDNIKLLSLKQFKKKFKSNIIASY